MSTTISNTDAKFIAMTVKSVLNACSDANFSYLGLEGMIDGYKVRTIEAMEILENIAADIQYDDQVLTLVRFLEDIMQVLTPKDMTELQVDQETIDAMDTIVAMYA